MPEQPTSDPSPIVPDGTTPEGTPADAAQAPATPAKKPSKRQAMLKRFGGAFLAIVAAFAFKAFTADDGTHGIKTGECVAAVGSNDFKKVDCSDTTALGKVTFIQTDAATDEATALSLCDKHGAQGAFTSSESEGSKGTVICVADAK